MDVARSRRLSQFQNLTVKEVEHDDAINRVDGKSTVSNLLRQAVFAVAYGRLIAGGAAAAGYQKTSFVPDHERGLARLCLLMLTCIVRIKINGS